MNPGTYYFIDTVDGEEFIAIYIDTQRGFFRFQDKDRVLVMRPTTIKTITASDKKVELGNIPTDAKGQREVAVVGSYHAD